MTVIEKKIYLCSQIKVDTYSFFIDTTALGSTYFTDFNSIT